MSSEIVTIDQVASFGDLVPPGKEFEARAVKGELKNTQPREGSNAKAKPYLSFTFRILAGDYEGLEVTKTYWLSYKKTNGKLYIRGVSELYDDLKAIGQAVPSNTPISLSQSDPEGRGLVTNGQDLLKLAQQRLHPERTPRIKFRSIGVAQQEKDVSTGKWVDAFNEDGSKKTRTEYLIVGVPGATATKALGDQATAIAGGSNPDEGTTQEPYDPLAFA